MKKARKLISRLMVLVFLVASFVTWNTFSAEAKTGKWKKDKKGWYYSYSDGTYAKKQWLKSDGKWYYFDASGYMHKGWKKLGKKYYFFKSDGSMASNEYCQGYWLNKDGSWTVKAKASWKQDSKGWYFGDTTGWYARKQWLKIDGKSYYFKNNGYLVTNEWVGKYCVNASGAWVPNASKDWVYAYKQAVRDFRKEEMDGNSSYNEDSSMILFGLIYLDDNSTPELWMRLNCYWGKPQILATYHNGKLTKADVGEFNYGTVEYLPKKGLLYKEVGAHFYWYSTLVRVKDGTITEIGKGSKPRDDGTVDVTNKWNWNGVDYNEAGYYKAVNKQFNNGKGKVSYDSEQELYTYNQIMDILDSYLD